MQDYEGGVIFHYGKHSGEKEPGLRWSFPVANEVRKVDRRTRTIQNPSQELMTKDNVTIHVDAVAFYKVSDLLKALCNIQDCDGAAGEAAQVCAFSAWLIPFFCLTAGWVANVNSGGKDPLGI